MANDQWVAVGRTQRNEVEILEPTSNQSQIIKTNEEISSMDLTEDHGILVVGLDGSDVVVYHHDGN